MSYAINDKLTADRYPVIGQGSSMLCGNTVRLVIQVTGGDVGYQLGEGPAGPNWEQEHKLLQGNVYALERTCDAIQFRSWAPGVPGTITVQALTQQDVSG